MSIYGVGGNNNNWENEVPQRPVNPPQKVDFSSVITPNGANSCYLDMGQLAGAAGPDGFRGYFYAGGPGGSDYYEANGLQNLINQLITQLKDAHVDSVDLSFAQLSDVQSLSSGTWQNTGNLDSILDMFQNAAGINTPPPVMNGSTVVAPNVLSFFTNMLNQAGIKIDLSIGGQMASNASDWAIGSNPAQTAQLLSNFMSEYHMSSVDFDIEYPSAVTAGNTSPTDPTGQNTVSTFFADLHENLAKQGMQSLITLNANVPTNPYQANHALEFLFQNSSGQNVFTNYFDGVNIMNYTDAGGVAYLDANNPVDGIEQWLSAVGNNPALLHIGFCAGLDYTNPATYNNSIPGSTNWLQEFPQIAQMTPGQAAAFIFQQLMAQVQKDTGINMSNMGEPFWWGGNPQNILNPSNGPLSADTMMQDFYNQLNNQAAPKNPKSNRPFGL